MDKVKRIAAFISIPKNASKTVLRTLNLGPNRDEESTDSLVIYENHQRGVVLGSKYELEDLFVFCFARNPYDRCISWYEYHSNKEFYKSLTFEEWVRRGMPHHWKQQNQTDYVREGLSPLLQYTYVEHCKVDFIGKVENFADDFRSVIEKLNSICAAKSIPQRFRYKPMNLNASRRRCARVDDYYNDETKEIVYSILMKDFSYFHYER